MATIADLRKSFSAMSYEEQFELIQKVQESRLTPKKSIKAKATKSKKKQMTFKELLIEVNLMHPDDRQKFLELNGMKEKGMF